MSDSPCLSSALESILAVGASWRSPGKRAQLSSMVGWFQNRFSIFLLLASPFAGFSALGVPGSAFTHIFFVFPITHTPISDWLNYRGLLTVINQ